jgi:hypothetical protein
LDIRKIVTTYNTKIRPALTKIRTRNKALGEELQQKKKGFILALATLSEKHPPEIKKAKDLLFKTKNYGYS